MSEVDWALQCARELEETIYFAGPEQVSAFIATPIGASILNGFTLRNGRGDLSSFFSGGGIHISSCSPVIMGNTITNNTSTSDGGGIAVIGEHASPTITGNVITNNIATFDGGGIAVGGGPAKIMNNVISNNRASDGSGVSVVFSSALIQGNTISNNGRALGAEA